MIAAASDGVYAGCAKGAGGGSTITSSRIIYFYISISWCWYIHYSVTSHFYP